MFLSRFFKCDEKAKVASANTKPGIEAPLAMVLEPRIVLDAAVADALTDAPVDNQADAAPDSGSHSEAADLANALSAPTDGRNELVFVDTTVEGYEALLQDIDQNVEVVLLSGTGDSVAEMTAALEGRSDLDAIHVISHGGEGLISIGTQTISAGNLDQYSENLSVIGQALSDNGDLLLYGCEIAGGEGQEFIDSVAEATGADVAASDDATGNVLDGGDWQLEVSTGSIETNAPFSEAALADFSGLLAIDDATGATIAFNSASYAGAYSSDSTKDAQYTSGSYIIDFDGTSAGTVIDTVNYGAYLIFGHTDQAETKITISMTNGATFDATSIFLYNFSGSPMAFKVTSDVSGDSATSSSLADLSGESVTLTGFEGITKLYIENNGGGTIWGSLDNLIIKNASASSNNDPTITGAPSDVTVTEDTASNVDLSSVTVADADGDNITLKIAAGAGTVANASGNGTFSGVTVSGSGSGTLSLAGSAANINTYLDTTSNIQYTGASNAQGNNATTLTLTVDDGTSGDVGSTSVNVDITNVNDDPTASGVPTDITVTEDTASNVDLSAVTLADVDSSSVTLTITAGAGTFSTPADGAGVGSGVTETLVNATTITLAGSVADINTYLDTASNIQYTGASEAGGNDVTTLTLTVNDGDGSGDVSLGTVNVDITAVNDAPVLSTSASPSLTGISEDLGAPSNGSTANSTLVSALIDSGGSLNNVSDVDSSSFGIAIVGVNSGTVYYSTNGGTTWTALGAVSANSALVLNADANTRVYFSPSADVNGTISDAITFKAWDRTSSSNGSTGVDTTSGTAFSSATDTVSVSISAVNDAPTATGVPSDVAVTEETASNVDLSALTLSDVDGDNVTLTITAGAGTFSTPADGSGVGSGVTETLVNATTITLAGSVADINTYLDTASNIQYTGANNAQGNDVTTLTLTVNDGNGSGDVSLGTVNVDITNVNDAPTASGTYNFTSINEDTTATGVQVSTIVSGLTTADVDGDTLGVAVTGTSGNGTWQFSHDSTNGTDGTWTSFAASNTPSDTTSLLLAQSAWVRYVPDSQNSETATISMRGWDQTSGTASSGTTARYADTSTNGNATAYSSGTATGSQAVTAVNDVPVVDLNGATGGNDNTATFSAGGSATSITATDATITDVDTGDAIESMTVTLGARPDGDSVESLSLNATATTAAANASLTVSYTQGTGVLSISGTAGPGVYQTILRGVQYNNSDAAADITTGNRSITVVANDGDGNATTRTSTMSVVTAPVVDLNGATSGSNVTTAFSEGNTDVIIAADATVTEPDGDNLNQLTIQLTNAQDGASESITLSGRTSGDVVNGITITYDSATQITLSGATTASNYQTLLRELIYNNSSENPDTTARTIEIAGRDINGNTGATSTATVNMTAVNDDPSATGLPSDVTVTEDTSSNVDLSAITLSDVDAGSGNITLTLTAGAGTLAATSGGSVTVSGSGSGEITLTGTLSNVDTFLNTASNIKYTGATDATGNDAATLTVKINDGGNSGTGGGSDVTLGTVNVDITAVNDNPSVTGLPSDVTVTEDTVSNVDLSALTLVDVDSTGTGTVTIAVGGGTLTATSSGSVTVAGSGSGTLTLTGTFSNIDTFLNTASNIQYINNTANAAGDNSDTLTLTANDGDGSGNVNLGSVNVDITAVNDAPSATGLPSDVTVTEDTASNIDLSAITLSDLDAGSGNISLTLTASAGTLAATSSGSVTVSGSGSGEITLTGTLANVDTFLNTASSIKYTGAADVNGNNAATLTVKINDGGNTGTGGGSDVTLGTVSVDITAVNDDPTGSGLPTGITVDAETASDVDFSGLTIEDVDAASSDVILTISAGDGTLEAASGSGVTVTGSGSGTLSLQGAASSINAFLATASNIQFTNESGATTLTVTVNDNGNTGPGGGSDVTLGTVNVEITSANDNSQGGLNDLNSSDSGSDSGADGDNAQGEADGADTWTFTSGSSSSDSTGSSDVNFGPGAGDATTSGAIAASSGLTSSSTLSDPTAGMQVLSIVHNAVTGNDAALNNFYGSGTSGGSGGAAATGAAGTAGGASPVPGTGGGIGGGLGGTPAFGGGLGGGISAGGGLGGTTGVGGTGIGAEPVGTGFGEPGSGGEDGGNEVPGSDAGLQGQEPGQELEEGAEQQPPAQGQEGRPQGQQSGLRVPETGEQMFALHGETVNDGGLHPGFTEQLAASQLKRRMQHEELIATLTV
jgi:hypothetical protein